MIRLATAEQSLQIDRLSQERGIPGAELMETAGCTAARWLAEKYPQQTFHVLCGPGNNGGDGLVVARVLAEQGMAVEVFLPEGSVSPLNQMQQDRWDFQSKPLKDFLSRSGSAIVVDALFGVGLNKPIDGLYAEVIRHANQYQVVSLDSPSGLDCNRGVVLGEGIEAQFTLTFGLAKPGFYLNQGPHNCGQITVFDIGFPQTIVEESADTHSLYDWKAAQRQLPVRGATSNKARHGRLLVIAGQPGMWGAGALVCRSAFRSGVGYVDWLSDGVESSGLCPDAISVQKLSDIDFARYSGVVIGPGLGDAAVIPQAIGQLRELDLPTVIDADALNWLAREPQEAHFPGHFIFTPHAGELSRLIDRTSSQIEADRLESVNMASQKMGGIWVLKGFHTIVANSSRFRVIAAGNSALATAGTGDVLAGLIGGLCAQRIPPIDSTCLGSYIHGRCADQWVESGRDGISMMASDVIEGIPTVIHKLRNKG